MIQFVQLNESDSILNGIDSWIFLCCTFDVCSVYDVITLINISWWWIDEDEDEDDLSSLPPLVLMLAQDSTGIIGVNVAIQDVVYSCAKSSAGYQFKGSNVPL